MKIAIASIGRFHVLDLARELDHLGLETLFYSYVPVKRGERFGLPAKVQRSVLPYVWPLVGWQRYAGSFAPRLQERAMARGLNLSVQARLEPCDVFICMSGMYLEAARYAKRRFGAQVWLERGSRHILSQRQILREAGAAGPSDFIVARETAGYEIADRIVVPSRHVVQSFNEIAPNLAPKLFVNPYGVDIEQFPATTVVPSGLPTVLCVGGWSRQKGSDILVEAIRLLEGVQLLHVGSIVDLPFPKDAKFQHVDPVPQWQLREYYARAHVFAMASRQEGLALVQAQALASGLPLVCTDRTGGVDLGLSEGLRDRILEVPHGDAGALADALRRTLVRAEQGGFAPLADADRRLLDWSAYGRRYADELRRAL